MTDLRNLAQGGPEWLEARKSLLTASNAAAAIGISPYTSRQKLYRELIGEAPPFEGNPATDYGTQYEPQARFDYEAHTGAFVEETGLWVHNEHTWLGASLDGLVDDGICEFKCRFSQELWEEVPPIYMAQIQLQMEISDRPWCDFVSWAPDELAIFRVPRSETYWKFMLPLLDKFWQEVTNRTPPKRGKKPTPPEIEVERLL